MSHSEKVVITMECYQITFNYVGGGDFFPTIDLPDRLGDETLLEYKARLAVIILREATAFAETNKKGSVRLDTSSYVSEATRLLLRMSKNEEVVALAVQSKKTWSRDMHNYGNDIARRLRKAQENLRNPKAAKHKLRSQITVTRASRIADLNVRTASAKALAKGKILTIEDFVRLGPWEILRVPGIGRGILHDIIDALYEVDIDYWNEPSEQ